MANTNVVDVDEFTDPGKTMGQDEIVTPATWLESLQPLYNRTRYLLNRLGGVDLPASTVYGRASSGVAEGKSTSDYSFGLFPLSSVRAWFDALHAAGANIAAAATTNLATATGHLVQITGTGVTVTSFGSASAGVRRTIYFASNGVIIANSANIQLPGAQDFESLAGDALDLVSLGGGQWKVLAIHRYDGVPPQTIVLVDNPEYGGGDPQTILEVSDGATNRLLTDADTLLIDADTNNIGNVVGIDLSLARLRKRTIVNAGTTVDFSLMHNSWEPLAEYRFSVPAGADFTLDPGESVDIVWDPALQRIRVLGPGAPAGM